MGRYLDKLKRFDRIQPATSQPTQGRVVNEPAASNFAPLTTVSSASVGGSRGIEIQPAEPDARPVYWETGTGRIVGPAKPEFLARDGESYWIVTTFEQAIWWINADRLRSRKAFETQREVREVELMRF